MNFPLDAMGDLPKEHQAAFMATLEHMQIRDRCAIYRAFIGKAAHGQPSGFLKSQRCVQANRTQPVFVKLHDARVTAVRAAAAPE